MSEGTVWLVETGEYEQRDVSIAFTSKALAKAHAKRVGGEAFGIPLFNRAVTYHPCYVRIAEVLRDGTVQQFAREEEWTEPGPQPLDKNSSLREIPGSRLCPKRALSDRLFGQVAILPEK